MTCFKTLALLHLFVDLLAPITKLSEYLQGDSTNLLLAQSAVVAALMTLARRMHLMANNLEIWLLQPKTN